MFPILKYIKPVWYFNLRPEKDPGYFPSAPPVESEWLKPDNKFNGVSRQDELAYRIHKFGLEENQTIKPQAWWDKNNLSIKEEYRFARKYFNPVRVFGAFILRILFLHNPVTELFGYITSAGIKRAAVKHPSASLEKFKAFKSPLIEANPDITVVIPTLNRYEYLKDVLSDLEQQTYRNFNVIVIDQSDPYDESVYENRDLKLEVIRQKEKALWKARNSAINKSSAEFMLLYDDDSRVNPDWITQHIKCIDFFGADISSGVSYSTVGGTIPYNYSFFRWSDQLDTGNVMIRRKVFETTGLFDLQFEKQRMGDGEFGLRAYLKGFKNISNPMASRVHLKVEKGGLREMGSWDAFRPVSLWSPRPVPSVLYLSRKYFGNKASIISLLINTPPSVIPYRFKKNRLLIVAGSLLSVFISPLIIIQVMRSWKKSTIMLRKDKIPYPDFKNQ